MVLVSAGTSWISNRTAFHQRILHFRLTSRPAACWPKDIKIRNSNF